MNTMRKCKKGDVSLKIAKADNQLERSKKRSKWIQTRIDKKKRSRKMSPRNHHQIYDKITNKDLMIEKSIIDYYTKIDEGKEHQLFDDSYRNDNTY
jgi:hypothetical protein